MAIIPNLQAMESISRIMLETLQALHRFIEMESKHNSEETMVLMMSFTTGLILQLRDKLETLENGLGNKYLMAVNELTHKGSKGLETIEKLNRNDPSLKQSSSGIDPDDLPAAVGFLQNKLNNDIRTHLEALPYVLRNDITLSHALAMLVANLFSNLDSKNVNSLIDTFAANARIFANQSIKSNKPDYN
jgi:hypothetical protein